ncbi:uncharacterized protein SCHCODRAFT_02486599 [Schizophyllum commune H4-8]|uniref:Glycosyltransferase family 31 protein n=1 Tax=Schizophyllum commune (strain H4-8 / FGSC 9210) TaxID=578458 RepID=D8PQD4_SCHCM|nr:uncharacterized protein SCHCODRAFT_02486599 [Schizophyllum commune H4-8]KAI5898188.1 hypothetical protein SCHCODRAFT_02486599 [Schizophyllum commune H4-8]
MARLRVAAALTSILVAVLAAVLWKSGEQHQIFDVPSGLGFAKFSWTSFRQSKPDTTAVVLNWSRLPNVVRIASLLCEHSLDDAIASDFAFTGCPTTKLKIHNSPENLYFQARFLACAQSTTEFCFIQDDDYIVWPSVIQSLHARIANSDVRGVHLLPPHEHLSSTLQTVVAPPNIHTDFAWLGHGAIIRRSVCTEFLSLLEHLKMDDEQRKMADNYYTILSNTFTEKWFDQGYELGGGQPFTVGTEGDLRNQRHIASATQMLDQLFAGETSPCARGVPYVDCSNDVQAPKLSHAPCKDTACLFQTNIQLLPAISAQASRAAELAKVAQDSDAALGTPISSEPTP